MRNCLEIFGGIFLRNFFEEFLSCGISLEECVGRNCLGGFFLGGLFWKEFLGRIFLGRILGRILLGGFFGRNSFRDVSAETTGATTVAP